MASVTFKTDHTVPLNSSQSVTYRAGQSYWLTPEAEEAARVAGVLVEKRVYRRAFKSDQ